jgi:hypothetical protein
MPEITPKLFAELVRYCNECIRRNEDNYKMYIWKPAKLRAPNSFTLPEPLEVSYDTITLHRIGYHKFEVIGLFEQSFVLNVEES